MIFTCLGIIIAIMIIVFGAYYLVKERNDNESKKIYSVVTGIGFIILIIMIVKLIFQL